MAEPTPRLSRSDTREVIELRALRERHPELTDAIDMHLELLEMQRRVQGRIPLPSFALTVDIFTRHQSEARPLLKFEDIPLALTDLRLIVRQTADIMRRFGALESDDCHRVQAMGRDEGLVDRVSAWYRARSDVREGGSNTATPHKDPDGPLLDQVFMLAMRPFLARCAEVLQPSSELSRWTHAHCPLCGGEPDFSVITPAAERHLICGRCALRWKFEPLTCPYCLNSDRSRITSFATTDGQYRVYACDVCTRYLKAYDARRAPRPVMPVVDSIATLPLDAAAIQRGYSS
ncbi:MAG: formate dehydrogenase accessory protein FdhE [Acidobacteria bacterium]|nr:formate dehydrogenase accessory protein FdhE [Acidobacteriota bacterium]